MPTLGIVVLIGLAVAGAAAFFFARDRRLKRRVRALPLRPIAETPEDEDVRVTGILEYVETFRTLRAPLSGRPCAAWRVVVEERRGTGKNSHYYTIVDECDSTDFLLRDPSGVAFVEGADLTLALHFDERGGTGLFWDEPSSLEAFLEERGIQRTRLLIRSDFKCREGILEAGEQVTVAGRGEWQKDPSQRGQESYRDVGRRLRIGAMSDGTLIATDDRKTAEPG